MDREPFGSACPLQSTPPMQLVHLVARMRRPYRFFAQFDHAAWMWQRLEVGFPDAVARNLMLNHLHNLGLVDDPVQARNYLARVCGHLQRRVGIPDLFEPLPPPEIVPLQRAARVARYVDLNAVRAGLVDHPLAWPWSTVRDLVGAVAKPAVDRSLHARALGHRRATRPDDWLSYLATDDRVVDRRPLQPPVSASSVLPGCSVEALREAVCSALRVRPSAFRKAAPPATSSPRSRPIKASTTPGSSPSSAPPRVALSSSRSRARFRCIGSSRAACASVTIDSSSRIPPRCDMPREGATTGRESVARVAVRRRSCRRRRFRAPSGEHAARREHAA